MWEEFFYKYFLLNIQNIVTSIELIIILLFMYIIFLINFLVMFSFNHANNNSNLILFLLWTVDSDLEIFYLHCLFLCAQGRFLKNTILWSSMLEI